MKKDRIFMSEPPGWAGFQFDKNVAGVFDDMLNRSIPGYSDLQEMILNLVDCYYQEGTAIYDLGCSLATMLAKIHLALGSRVNLLVGVDTSLAMIEKAGAALQKEIPEAPVTLLCDDIKNLKMNNPSVAIMNYTLQFIRPVYRSKVLQNVYTQLNPGGILILSEKVLEDDPEITAVFQDIYYRFKMENGYSASEIARKRECLEHVLVPYSVQEYFSLLHDAGFQSVSLIHKWFNFASILAVK
jgi:tRNA (cmo5U34)-methyltransferase